MKKLHLNIIHNRLKRGTAKKAVSVEIRVSFGSERKYMSTGVLVTPNNWSDTKKMVLSKCKDADLMNETIHAFYLRVKKITDRMIEEGITDLDLIPTLMQNEVCDKTDFIAYCEKRTNERNVCEHTKKRYVVFTKFLRSWGKITLFSDCNVANIRAMDEFLHQQGKKASTIYDYHKYLKLFINDASVDGLIDVNPYTKLPFKINRGEKQYVECITEDQFIKIKELHLNTPHLCRARDLFLFQVYTGLAYSDLMAFDFSACEEEEKKMVYKSQRTKTDTDFSFQLLAPAMEILRKYDFKLPHLSNQKYNDYLKVIGMMAGVSNLRSHMGRGTAATLFLSKGMPINVVMKVLGHTTLRQTTRYARTLNKDIRGAFDKLEGKL